MKTKKEVRDVWIVQGTDSYNQLQFMMVCASEDFAKEQVEKNTSLSKQKLTYEIEQWAVCGH